MIQLLLPNIRSAQNVGTIFRTAEAFAVDEILLSGYTPQPVDRFGRDRADIAKAALGAEKMIAWRAIEEVERFLEEAKENPVYIVGLEQEEDSVSLAETGEIKEMIRERKNILLVVGNEVDGIDQEIRSYIDTFIEIPMLGKKESLNVAVATGMMLWELLGKQDRNEPLDR